jgi:hypothetical protein
MANSRYNPEFDPPSTQHRTARRAMTILRARNMQMQLTIRTVVARYGTHHGTATAEPSP